MEVNGIIVIDMKKRVLRMQETIKLKAVPLLNDTFMYLPTWTSLTIVLQSIRESRTICQTRQRIIFTNGKENGSTSNYIRHVMDRSSIP